MPKKYLCHSFRIIVIPSVLFSFLLYYCHSFLIIVNLSELFSFPIAPNFLPYSIVSIKHIVSFSTVPVLINSVHRGNLMFLYCDLLGKKLISWAENNQWKTSSASKVIDKEGYPIRNKKFNWKSMQKLVIPLLIGL